MRLSGSPALLGEVANAKGEPWLWVVECFNPSDEPADPLELTIATGWACQIDDPSLGTVLTDADGQGSETWEELISERIFAQDIPPRWVLAVSRDQLLLIDRQKWAASRLLRFELNTLLGEINPDALLAAATLLHREHTCPTGGGTPQYERDTWYDRNGRIVFTASKGLTGVGFPRKGSGRGANRTTGWEDIQDMKNGSVRRTILDDTLPGGPVERTIIYEAPWSLCDRVQDYRVAWEFFDNEGERE